jgi:iron complex transport system ATP-binding protein
VMVTHHVEEIPPAFTHAMLMAKGRITSSGRISDVITAANLSLAFGVDLELTTHAGRFAARAR